VIVLLIFGPKRLPGLGRQLGQGMREFKDSITGNSKDDEAEARPELTSATASTPEAAPAQRESASQRSV
jgi:sec-independent protein translocase protein TatA